MICPKDDCGSGNIELLSHYWDELPGESAHRATYAPPPGPDSWMRLVGVLVGIGGILVLVTGGIVFGLVLLAGGAVAAAVGHQRMADAEVALAAWKKRLLCKTCSHRWDPK